MWSVGQSLGLHYNKTPQKVKLIYAWEQRELSRIAKNIGTGRSAFVSGVSESLETPYAVLGSTSIISFDNSFDHDGDFILTARVRANAGTLYRHSGKVKISDNTVYIQGRNLDFIFYLLEKYDLKTLSFGTGQPLIKASELKRLALDYPREKEQTSISNFFCTLDNTIAIYKRKLGGLREFKKAFLQVMFPQKEETVPRVRFEGFSEPWHIKKISELVTLTLREVPKPTEPYKRISLRSHAKGTFHQTVDDPDKVAMDSLYVVHENDLIVNITFAWEHAIAIAAHQDHGLFVSHRFPTYVIDKSDVSFLRILVTQEAFRQKLELISPGGAGRNRVLNKGDFVDLDLVVPCTDEQAVIGMFFNALDNHIVTQSRKLELLRQLKSAYLQKMFV